MALIWIDQILLFLKRIIKLVIVLTGCSIISCWRFYDHFVVLWFFINKFQTCTFQRRNWTIKPVCGPILFQPMRKEPTFNIRLTFLFKLFWQVSFTYDSYQSNKIWVWSYVCDQCNRHSSIQFISEYPMQLLKNFWQQAVSKNVVQSVRCQL